MKTIKNSTILVLAFGLMVFISQVSRAETMGTAFTYQGRLIDANKAADGLYDIQFKLFDANVAGTQKGSTVDVNELDVIDGQFTILLDFGSDVFNGDARGWRLASGQVSLKTPMYILCLVPVRKSRRLLMPFMQKRRAAAAVRHGK